ncbi:MAG: 2-amino-4-hydroxy-6-hydroxymethyldihydropteridine diphosphokinase [Bacteroidetes bacterium]|nr:2-amino-4-hydroxy-6-hydroxymethyldihydropteridine diphosphokinase [Bacteroidota bacterium]
MTATAYLLIGTNLGNRVNNLQNAIQALKNLGEITGVSSIYETEPWGLSSQPTFLNQALMLETSLIPTQLLTQLKAIEKELGRTPSEQWGSRLIDIDILIYGTLEIQSSELIIPHPRIAERRFALIPLCELNPNLIIPGSRVTIQHLLDQCKDNLGVSKVDL